jgi:hypothetical protein
VLAVALLVNIMERKQEARNPFYLWSSSTMRLKMRR